MVLLGLLVHKVLQVPMVPLVPMVPPVLKVSLVLMVSLVLKVSLVSLAQLANLEALLGPVLCPTQMNPTILVRLIFGFVTSMQKRVTLTQAPSILEIWQCLPFAEVCNFKTLLFQIQTQ
jgi:hypothetical protein